MFTVALHPETRVTISSTTAIVPPYASISYDEHRVWMNAQERQALAAFAGTGQAFSYPSTTDRKASQPPVGATSVFTIATNTAHHAMAVLREA